MSRNLSPNEVAVIVHAALTKAVGDDPTLDVIHIVGPLPDDTGSVLLLQLGGDHILVTAHPAELRVNG